MKKTVLVIALVVLALGVLGVGAVFAQDAIPPVVGRGSMMQNGTSGPIHTFMAIELAKKLDLNVNDVNTRLAAGETMYDIALSAGVTDEEFPALMTEVRANAVDAAMNANVLTREQADWIQSRGRIKSGANGASYDGDCPMQTGDYQSGTGFRGGWSGGMTLAPGANAGMNGNGRGGMMGGWGVQQTSP